jgi:arylsulfatase A-like enzyme
LGFDAESSPTGAEPELLLRAIAETPEPFFLWFHYKWTHLPYWGSEAARARLGFGGEAVEGRLRGSVGSSFVLPRGSVSWEAEDARVVRGLYASNVLDLDAWCGEVLEAVSRRGLEGRTTLALTSDHGEELLERGHVGHASTAHHGALYEESLRVPLFVLDARLRGARLIDAPTQSVDLFPTLLGLVGVEAPPSDGIDLSAALLEGAAMPAALEGRVMWFHSARAGYLTPRAQEGQEVVGAALGDERVIWERYDQERWMYFDLSRDPGQRSPQAEGAALEAWRERLISRRSG